MKKIIFALLTLCFSMNMIAQEHLTFMGIPMNIRSSEFYEKLKSKGFQLIKVDGNDRVFDGEFTGKSVGVSVGTADNGKRIHTVMVFFDPSTEWVALTNSYDYYKRLYTSKYGEPSLSEENNPAYPDTNIALMHELSQGRVNYYSAWDLPGGEIRLTILKDMVNLKGVVVINYSDKINAEIKMQKDLEDI